MGVTPSVAEAIVLCFLSAVISHTPSKNTQTALSSVSAAGLAGFDRLKVWEEGDHEMRKREREREGTREEGMPWEEIKTKEKVIC